MGVWFQHFVFEPNVSNLHNKIVLYQECILDTWPKGIFIYKYHIWNKFRLKLFDKLFPNFLHTMFRNLFLHRNMSMLLFKVEYPLQITQATVRFMVPLLRLRLRILVIAECVRYASANTVATINTVMSPHPPLSSLCLLFSQKDFT